MSMLVVYGEATTPSLFDKLSSRRNRGEFLMTSIDSIVDAAINKPESIEFSDVMAAIDASYQYSPTSFNCGATSSVAGSNEGSCKILALGKMHDLTEGQTLSLFGSYYREDVLKHPDGDDHANIRNFMMSGWAGVSFEREPLTAL